MRKLKRNLTVLIILALLVLVISLALYQRGITKPFSDKSNEVIFLVSPGDGVKKISSNLLANNLIGSKFLFELYVKNEGLATSLQAGPYNLSTDMSIKDIVAVIASGKAIVDEQSIKIIEGWNNKDLADYFVKQNIFSKEDVSKELALKDKYRDRFDFIDEIPDGYDLEGFLFPDTYKIYKDASIEDVVVKMLTNFNEKVTPEMREDIKSQGRSLYEVITLASIIEEEVRSVEDMRLVSGIFSNRLKIGQPLQSCATLAYILGIKKSIYSIEDTKIDSPYNTYQNIGLPPGPISNPGLNAIEAAIHPAETDYFYFLSATETGETIFAKTFAEHNINKAKYLK